MYVQKNVGSNFTGYIHSTLVSFCFYVVTHCPQHMLTFSAFLTDVNVSVLSGLAVFVVQKLDKKNL